MAADAKIHDPSGLVLPARVTLLVCAAVVTVAMTPCLGLLNWFAAPLCLAPLVLGILGLMKVSAAPADQPIHPGPFLGALLGSSLLLVFSLLRLLLGMGVI